MSGSVDVTVNPVDVNINGLDNINADVTADLGLDDIHLKIDELKADFAAKLTLDELKADLKADLQASLKELAPIFFNFLWKEIPIVKIGSPHRYRLGFHLCGKEIFAFTFCGESELITERNPRGDGDCRPPCNEPGGAHGNG